MENEILQILFQSQKAGNSPLSTFDLLKNLSATVSAPNSDIFKIFKSLLNQRLIKEVELKNSTSMHFEITAKGSEFLLDKSKA